MVWIEGRDMMISLVNHLFECFVVYKESENSVIVETMCGEKISLECIWLDDKRPPIIKDMRGFIVRSETSAHFLVLASEYFQALRRAL